jgi:hypothetical protein
MVIGKQTARQAGHITDPGAVRRERAGMTGAWTFGWPCPPKVLTALSERDATIASTERRAGGGFAGDDHEHLTMSEAVRWYAGTITDRDAARLRQMARGRTTTTDQRRGRAALWPSYSAAGRSARERCGRGIRS